MFHNHCVVLQTRPLVSILLKRHFLKKSKFGTLDKFVKPSSKQTCYDHIVQIGDPILRAQCRPVLVEDITSPTISTLIAQLKRLLVRYDAVGVSAPQIGVPAAVSVVQLTRAQLSSWPDDLVERQCMQPFGLKVLINPELRITDNESISHRESCCSIYGLSAIVPRAKSVEVSYLNEEGKKEKWTASEWTARILQHEVDHLNGVLFTDRMKNETLTFNYWETVNKKGGDFKLSFSGVDSFTSKLNPLNFMKIYQT